RAPLVQVYNAPARPALLDALELCAWLPLHGCARERRSVLAFDETDDPQQYGGSDHGVDDGADEAGERHESQLREQPHPDEGADDADDDVPDQSEPKAAHDLPGQPASDRTDDDHDDDAVYSNHDILPLGQT